MKLLTIILLLFPLSSCSQKMELKKLKELLSESKYNSIITSQKQFYVKHTNRSIEISIDGFENGKSLRLIQEDFKNSFIEFEKSGWNTEHQADIYNYYKQIGRIIGIEDPIAYLNTFDNSLDLKKAIEQIRELRKQEHFKRIALPQYPDFYAEMRKLMNQSLDNIINILETHPSIENVLNEYERSLIAFNNLKTATFSFGDTEDREAVGAIYNEVCDILHMDFTRGILSRYL